MAKGQHLSRYQKGIVRRYYEHLDTLTLQKLQELVSDLYLAGDEKSAARLWKQAAAALERAGVEAEKTAALTASRDVKGLAALVGEMAAPGKK